jgi:flavodoxin
MIIFKDMGTCESIGHVESRGLVQLIYSSTSGTSKDAALKMQELLEENKYLAPVINIGDFDTDELINHHGTIIFFLSTYGDGSSPSDGETFLQWT